MMNKDETEFIGKKVKDMYGNSIGKVIGTITDIDGTVQTVGIDCGADALKQIPFDQLVVQGEYVIFIPKWRLEAQKLLREKGLTLRRIKALMDIVQDNDSMKDDAELIHEKYKVKLLSLDETEKEIKEKLKNRLKELEDQLQSIRLLVFDAKLQYKSSEISTTKYDSVKTNTAEMMEHIEHEKAEIKNIQKRIEDLSVESFQELKSPKQDLQQAAVSYLDETEEKSEESPEASAETKQQEDVAIPSTVSASDINSESSWDTENKVPESLGAGTQEQPQIYQDDEGDLKAPSEQITGEREEELYSSLPIPEPVSQSESSPQVESSKEGGEHVTEPATPLMFGEQQPANQEVSPNGFEEASQEQKPESGSQQRKTVEGGTDSESDESNSSDWLTRMTTQY